MTSSPRHSSCAFTNSLRSVRRLRILSSKSPGNERHLRRCRLDVTGVRDLIDCILSQDEHGFLFQIEWWAIRLTAGKLQLSHRPAEVLTQSTAEGTMPLDVRTTSYQHIDCNSLLGCKFDGLVLRILCIQRRDTVSGLNSCLRM